MWASCGYFSSGEETLWQNAPGWLLARNTLLLLAGWRIALFRGRRKILVRSG